MGILKLVDTDRTPIEKEKPKRERRQIRCIETRPQPDWVIEDKDEDGQSIYYTNIKVTGLWPRRYGPFESHQAAALVLDDGLNLILDALLECENMARKQTLVRPRRPLVPKEG